MQLEIVEFQRLLKNGWNRSTLRRFCVNAIWRKPQLKFNGLRGTQFEISGDPRLVRHASRGFCKVEQTQECGAITMRGAEFDSVVFSAAGD
jgi:hypothetical protein